MGFHYRAYGIKHLKFHAYFTTNHIDDQKKKIKIVSGFWSSSKDHTLSSVLSPISLKTLYHPRWFTFHREGAACSVSGKQHYLNFLSRQRKQPMLDFLWLCSDKNGPAEYHLFSKFCPCVFVELKIVSNFHTNPPSVSLVRLIYSLWLDYVIWPKLNYLLPYFPSP